MNKYLLLAAAGAIAVTANAGVVQAATTISLGSYCDYFVITRTGDMTLGGQLYAAKHVGAQSCSSNTWVVDVGFNTGKKKKGVATFEDATLEMVFPSLLLLTTPFKAGGTWEIVASESSTGSTALVVNSGTYKLGKPDTSSGQTLSAAIKALRTLK